jgi:hypothetical protein
VHRCSESGSSIRCKGHEPPLTVLAEEELPELADPVESADDPVLEADEVEEGVVVVDVAPVEEVTDEVVALVVADVPACVAADAAPSTTTAALPATPKDIVSLRRRRNARSRSSTVMRRFGADITSPPAHAQVACVSGRGPARMESCAATAAHLAGR